MDRAAILRRSASDRADDRIGPAPPMASEANRGNRDNKDNKGSRVNKDNKDNKVNRGNRVSRFMRYLHKGGRSRSERMPSRRAAEGERLFPRTHFVGQTTRPGVVVRMLYKVPPPVMYSVLRSSPPKAQLVTSSVGTARNASSLPSGLRT